MGAYMRCATIHLIASIYTDGLLNEIPSFSFKNRQISYNYKSIDKFIIVEK